MAVKATEVDHYKVLGLRSGNQLRNLTFDDIKRAYKRKALELHPDKRPDDPHASAKFQRLQFSKDVLLDHFSSKKFHADSYSEQFKASSAMKRQRKDPDPEAESEPESDKDPDAEERRRNAWREFLKNHPSRVRDLHIRRSFWGNFSRRSTHCS